MNLPFLVSLMVQNVFLILLNSLKKIGQVRPIVVVRSFEESLLDELGFGVPSEYQPIKGSLKNYIETITEREIKTPKVLKKL